MAADGKVLIHISDSRKKKGNNKATSAGYMLKEQCPFCPFYRCSLLLGVRVTAVETPVYQPLIRIFEL